MLYVFGREFGMKPAEVAAMPIRVMRVLLAARDRAAAAESDDGDGVAVATRAPRVGNLGDDALRRAAAGMPVV